MLLLLLIHLLLLLFSLSSAACNASCYSVLPQNEVIYASIGDSFEIFVQHLFTPTFSLAREGNGSIYTVVNDDDVCGGDTSVCHLDNDAARFKINSFQPYLAGNYEYRYYVTFTEFCPTPFTLKVAGKLY